MGRLLARFLLMFVTAVAALYAVALFVGALLASSGLPVWPASPLAFIVSLLVSRYVWTHSAAPPAGLTASIVMGTFVVGAIGFAIGFFGPIVFTPRANQGPLLDSSSPALQAACSVRLGEPSIGRAGGARRQPRSDQNVSAVTPFR